MTRFTQPQLNATRRRAEEFERNAMSNARSIRRLQEEMRGIIVKGHETEWSAAFYEDTSPERSRQMRLNLPRFQRALEANVAAIRTYQESMAINVAAALAEKRVLDRYERRVQRREPSGLWLLIRLCWRGWRAARLAS